MARMPWFRVYIEIIDDPKLADKTDSQKWDWICLLALAREAKEAGVIRLTPEQIAWRLRRSPQAIRETLEAFTATMNENGDPMIVLADDSIIITKFLERQYDKPSDRPDHVKRRVTRHRCNADETPMKRQSNAIDTDTESDTDTERDKKIKKLYALSVKLTEEQYAKLIDRFGEKDALDRIERLSLYKQSKGKRYKCDYSTILNWARKEEQPKHLRRSSLPDIGKELE